MRYHAILSPLLLPHLIPLYTSHVMQERFYFGDNVLPCFESGVPLLLRRLQQLEDASKVASCCARMGGSGEGREGEGSVEERGRGRRLLK